MIRFLILFLCGLGFVRAEITPALLAVSNRTSGTPAEVATWLARVSAAGGTLAGNSESIATTLSTQLAAASYSSKIVYLLPLLGSNLAAARVPLRDTLGVGIATNTNFVDADFSQATGLQGNGTSKILDLLILPSQLGISRSGGLGYWETNISFSGSAETPIGNYSTSGSYRYLLDLRSSFRAFRWGDPNNGATQATSAVNGHYYGQRNGQNDRRIYLGGTLLATNATADASPSASDRTITLMGSWQGTNVFWAGRCAVAYMTDGTLSDAEVASLHTLLQTYLITPTGR